MSKPMPPLLKTNQPFWFMRHVRKNVMFKNKHFAAVVTGESGSGKSWASIALCEATYPNFDIRESVVFSPLQFLEVTAKHHPKMFPVILDDAGLSAFSGDALTAQVKNISKVAQSIRHKNWQIILNLPDISLLAKSVRITNHYIIEPKWIDYENEKCYIKFQRLKLTRAHKAREHLARRNLVTKMLDVNPVTGYYHVTKRKHLVHLIPAPSKKNIEVYEKLKEDFLNNFRRETAEALRIEKEKTLGKSMDLTTKASEEMRGKIDLYTTPRGSPDLALIKHEFGLGMSAARIAWNMAMLPKKKDLDKLKAKREKDRTKGFSRWAGGTRFGV